MFDLRKANRWKFPTVEYVNWKKAAPNAGANCWKRWFNFERYWSGKLWYFSIRHHQLQLDFRLCPWADMVFGNVTKQDRKAVDDALKENETSPSTGETEKPMP